MSAACSCNKVRLRLLVRGFVLVVRHACLRKCGPFDESKSQRRCPPEPLARVVRHRDSPSKRHSPRCVGVLTLEVTERAVCTQPAIFIPCMTSASKNKCAESGRTCSDVGESLVMFTYAPFEFKSSSYGRTICVTPCVCDSRELYV
jgi:hypothetical protein